MPFINNKRYVNSDYYRTKDISDKMYTFIKIFSLYAAKWKIIINQFTCSPFPPPKKSEQHLLFGF